MNENSEHNGKAMKGENESVITSLFSRSIRSPRHQLCQLSINFHLVLVVQEVEWEIEPDIILQQILVRLEG